MLCERESNAKCGMGLESEDPKSLRSSLTSSVFMRDLVFTTLIVASTFDLSWPLQALEKYYTLCFTLVNNAFLFP